MTDKLIFTCTFGPDEPERATLPFVAANIAATAGQEAIVLCTIDAAWLGIAAKRIEVASPGLPTLHAVYDEFVGNGGTVWLCGACTKPRGITEDQISNATIVGAAKVVEEVTLGARLVAFA